MAVKLIPFVVSKKSLTWVSSIKYFSSVSSAIHAQHNPEICPSRTEIDPKVQYLRNRLCPDELIRVLDRTPDLNSALKVFKWASLQKQFRHTASTYSIIIVKLGFTGNLDEMEEFCKEMVKDRCPGAEEALGDLLDLFVKNSRLDEAMRVLMVINSTGYKPSICKWNGLLGALVEARRDFSDVLLIYKEMVKSRIVPSVDTLNHLIKTLFDAGMVDNALDQFRRMRKKGCAPNCRTFEVVIHGLVASRRVSESLGVMNEMFNNDVDLDWSFYTHVIPHLCGENMLGEAMRLFEMMRASESEANMGVYESIVKCLCANHCLSKAIELFGEMRDVGFSPSVDVLVDIISAYCKLGDLDEARNCLDDIDVFDPSPYNVLLQGYCDSYRFLAAKALLSRMFLLNVTDSSSWNILIRGLCEMKNVKHACGLLGKMIISSYVPDSATYSSLVIGHCNLNKYKDAMELFQQVCGKDMILDPNSYAKLVEGLCNLGKFQEATEVFMYMSSRNCTLHYSSFNSLIKGFCAIGMVNEAIRLLKIGHHCECPVNGATYKAIMHGLFKVNRSNDALVFLSQILRRGLVLDAEAYCILIQCLSALCETKYCVLLFKLMVSEGFLPDSETLGNLLSHLANQSRLHVIWTVINSKFYQESGVLDPAMYNILINGLWKEGYKTEACQLLDTMLEKGWVPDANTHGLLIGSFCREEKQTCIHNNLVVQDEVSSILSEGLGEK